MLARQITYIQKQWISREIQYGAKKLQNESGEMNIKPVWEYAKLMGVNDKNTQNPLKNTDGTYANNAQDELKRWKERIKDSFYVTPEQTIPQLMHITEQQWAQIEEQWVGETQIPEPIRKIREQSTLKTKYRDKPLIYRWLTMGYTEKDIKKAIMSLKNNK